MLIFDKQAEAIEARLKKEKDGLLLFVLKTGFSLDMGNPDDFNPEIYQPLKSLSSPNKERVFGWYDRSKQEYIHKFYLEVNGRGFWVYSNQIEDYQRFIPTISKIFS